MSKNNIKKPIFTVLLLLLTLNGCGLSGLIRKTGPQHKKEVALWQKIITKKGGNGMWLIRRGYHYGEDILAIASFSYYSHIGILNLAKNEIIEAGGDRCPPLIINIGMATPTLRAKIATCNQPIFD